MIRPLLAAVACCVLTLSAVAGPAERLAESIRFRTISNQDPAQTDFAEFQRFNDFLRATYPRVFDELEVEVVNGYSLLLTWRGSEPDAGAILFTAHSDVVPIEPGTEGDWEHPPFDGVIADGIVHGRGTLDDKLGVISLLEAVGGLLAEDFEPRKTVVLAFGHDEEVSGKDGAAKIAERMQEKGLKFDWMVDEGGMLVPDNPILPGRPLGLVAVAEKGYLTLTLVASGEGGHSSMPPAESTIGRLSRALVRIEENPFPARLVGPVQAMLESIAPYNAQPQRTVLENLWLTGPLVARGMTEDRTTNPYVRTTTALTMFNAGVKENVVPQQAVAKVNFRLLPGDTPDGVVERITEIVNDPSISISYDNWDRVAPVADYSGSGFAIIREAVAEVYPDALVVPTLLVATTDTRHYIDVADDIYRFHGAMIPMSATTGIHGTNEQIGVDSFERAVEIAVRMIRKGAE